MQLLIQILILKIIKLKYFMKKQVEQFPSTFRFLIQYITRHCFQAKSLCSRGTELFN